MTKEEKHLWYDFLKDLPFTVNRQKVIGQYIADFYVAKVKLIIEPDGSQHYTEEGLQSDVERDGFFREQRMTVLRYSNLQILQQFREVCDDIWLHIDSLSNGKL